MPYYPKDFLERVIEATDLVELVRSYIPEMKKVSGRWLGLCPFHREKSGSFGVREGKRFWKCFGCGAGGDAVKFVMNMHGIKFPEAVERLASRANIPLPDGRPPANWKGPKKARRTRAQIEGEAAEKNLLAVAVRAEASMPDVLTGNFWGTAEMWEESRNIPEDGLGQAHALLHLFEPNDIVWCGVHADSIGEDDAKDPDKRRYLERVKAVRPFRTAKEWSSGNTLPGPRITPNAMRPGALARSDANVLARRFLVIEHDKLGLEEQGALLKWLSKKLTLRTVIFTGGKSLHGWFECPPTSQLPTLQAMLCGVRIERFGGKREIIGGMGFDPSVFVPSQPYRVPGWKHDKTGDPVQLCYYNPAGVA